MKEKSRQIVRSSTEAKRRIIFLIILVVAVLSIAGIVIYSMFIRYEPPKFEVHAVAGTPTPGEEFLYDEVESGFGYKFSIASNLYQQEDRTLKAFFTNASTNAVNLMCEVRNAEDDRLLYESGLLHPGEYVEALDPNGDFGNTKYDVNVKVYAFEPDTYQSAGTTTLNLVLQPW